MLDLDQARRRAKELLRAARAGDPSALARMRDDRAPRLADAQRAIAQELGFRSWPALVAHVEQVREETDLTYLPGRSVQIRVRHRGHRYDIDDAGAAVALAGRPNGWLPTARDTVERRGWNVNRAGVVFVQAAEGRDIDALITGTAEVSLAVFDALIALDD